LFELPDPVPPRPPARSGCGRARETFARTVVADVSVHDAGALRAEASHALDHTVVIGEAADAEDDDLLDLREEISTSPAAAVQWCLEPTMGMGPLLESGAVRIDMIDLSAEEESAGLVQVVWTVTVKILDAAAMRELALTACPATDVAAGQPQSAFAAMQSLLGPRQGPAWFDSSNKTVLDQAGVVMAARGPRELEQATAELLGAELHRVLREEPKGMWFSWWFEELTDAATARIREEVGRRDGAWEPPWRLLHGLTSIGSPALQSIARTALGRAKKELRGDAAVLLQPAWLRQLARITATGEVWEMRDAYGTRIALIAGFSYPDGVDRSVFLFDIDACGIIEIVHAGVFDDVQQAATAWQALVGDTAQDARPERVETAERLLCLVHCDSGEEILRGTESRMVLDNWFLARRRIHDLADALRSRGMPLPAARSLYHDLDTAPMAAAFTGWHVRRHGSEPDPEAVGALAQEWMEGTLPETWHGVSPHRVEF
jgi:hypothetical protein